MRKHYPRLNDETYEFIKEEASYLLVKYKIKCIPVSGFEIASKLGVTVIPYSSLTERKLKAAIQTSEDGFLIEYDEKDYIFYNDISQSYERQNWTILHEIGHIILDHNGYSWVEESEANFFAKYIIAPPVLVYKIHANDAMDIYINFDISYEAAVYAYCYYKKWLRQHQLKNKYTEYEKALLDFYEENVINKIA